MTILVPVDLEERSARIMEVAEHLCEVGGGEIHYLHVVETEPEFVGYEAGPGEVRDSLAAEIKAKHRKIQVMAALTRDKGLQAQAHVTHGTISRRILEEADRLGAGLIVMGRSGDGFIRDVIQGRVSQQVVSGAKVPVMIVP